MSAEEAPRELVVDAKPAPGDQSTTSGTAMTPLILPAVVAAVLAKAVSPLMGLFGLGVGVVVLLVLRKPDAGKFVLRIDGAEVEVSRDRTKEVVARFPLDDLWDVALDKEMRPATGGRGGAGPSERVRLAFERAAPADPVFVPEERLTPIEASEWLAKVRVFLRKHGWVPRDERAEDGP